jgi:hypothetical protein
MIESNTILKPNKTELPAILICDCSSCEHQIIIRYDEEDNFVYGEIHLATFSFWKRLVSGVKYIFGYHCKFGHWEEFIWKPEHADKLQELVNLLTKNEVKTIA